MCLNHMVHDSSIGRGNIEAYRVYATLHGVLEVRECVVRDIDHSMNCGSYNVLAGGGV